jgi:histidinol dehydrogenase
MIQIIKNPEASDFPMLALRPSIDNTSLLSAVQTIFNEVRRSGDEALLRYTQTFDGIKLNTSILALSELKMDEIEISSELKNAIHVAHANIEKFHNAQKTKELHIETMPGIFCSQKSVPIGQVGIYIPGGSAPLFSTVLMLAIPARLAGCKEIVMCTPPDVNGKINPTILYTALLCGISEIRLAGGAQAIAALTFGTKEIPAVYKIFGPGNQYVTAAKQLAQNYGVAIDMPAGPSELLVYADDTAVPSFVAADLLAQAEHGIDSQVILVTKNLPFAEAVLDELSLQLKDLPRRNIVLKALKNSKAIIFEDDQSAFDFIEYYAPEHLVIASNHAETYVPFITNAGSVFLGNYCPESAGDYASGTNHTLPTSGWAKSYSGLNMDAFFKKITFQTINKEGLNQLAPSIIAMAEGEQLQAHANAVKIRINTWK